MIIEKPKLEIKDVVFELTDAETALCLVIQELTIEIRRLNGRL